MSDWQRSELVSSSALARCSIMAMYVIGLGCRDAMPMLLTRQEPGHATLPNSPGTKADIPPSVPLAESLACISLRLCK
jgi:hypothetical protein